MNVSNFLMAEENYVRPPESFDASQDNQPTGLQDPTDSSSAPPLEQPNLFADAEQLIESRGGQFPHQLPPVLADACSRQCQDIGQRPDRASPA